MHSPLHLVKEPSRSSTFSLSSSKIKNIPAVIKSFRTFSPAVSPCVRHTHVSVSASEFLIRVDDHSIKNTHLSLSIAAAQVVNDEMWTEESKPIDLEGVRHATIPPLNHSDSTETVTTSSSTISKTLSMVHSHSDPVISQPWNEVSSSKTVLLEAQTSSSTESATTDALISQPITPRRSWSLESLRTLMRSQRHPDIRCIAVRKASKRVRFGSVTVHEVPNLQTPCVRAVRMGASSGCLQITLVLIGIIVSFAFSQLLAMDCDEVRGYTMEKAERVMPGFYDEEEWD